MTCCVTCYTPSKMFLNSIFQGFKLSQTEHSPVLCVLRFGRQQSNCILNSKFIACGRRNFPFGALEFCLSQSCSDNRLCCAPMVHVWSLIILSQRHRWILTLWLLDLDLDFLWSVHCQVTSVILMDLSGQSLHPQASAVKLLMPLSAHLGA